MTASVILCGLELCEIVFSVRARWEMRGEMDLSKNELGISQFCERFMLEACENETHEIENKFKQNNVNADES